MDASRLRACLGARVLLQLYYYPHLSEGADRVAGQLREDKECPFSGVSKSGRVWMRVPESDARSVICTQTFRRVLTPSVDSCAEIKECPFSGVTSFGRVWRKVPESDARGVLQ